MKNLKLTTRLMGYLRKRLGELNWEDVHDPRSPKGKRWKMQAFLQAIIAGLVSDQKSLRDVEALTMNMTVAVRRLLGIKKRIPDTTLRDALVRLCPDTLRQLLHDTVQKAIRRKALKPIELPCGAVAMDGKWTGTNLADEAYTQHHSESTNGMPVEQLRTVTSCLISSAAKVCLDAFLIPPSTNEKGIFEKALDALLTRYPSLFEIVTYDAGASSEANARYVHQKGLGYVFALKGEQGTLFSEAERLLSKLGKDDAVAETRDCVGKKTVIRRLWKTSEMARYNDWEHLRMVFRVESRIFNEATGGIESIENRYFITNVHVGRMTDAQWLLLIRRHWCVENNVHNILDRILREDDRVWIREPQGMLAVQLLRRLAYTLMSLFRSVTQRSEDKRAMPWKDLMREFYLAFVRFSKNDIPTESKLGRVFATIF